MNLEIASNKAGTRDTTVHIDREKTRLRVGRLNDPADVEYASEIASLGGIVVSQVRGVFGIWADSQNPAALEAVCAEKGSPESKTLSCMFPTQEIVRYVDFNRVHPHLRHLLENPNRLQENTANLCFFRVPVTPDAVRILPPSVISWNKNHLPVVHNLDPYQHPISNLIEASRKKGVPYLGVTSLNRTGDAEIYNLHKALTYCQDSPRVKIIITDPAPNHIKALGSFGIISLVEGEKEGTRDGHVPLSLMEKILQVTLDKTDLKPVKYPHAPEIKALLEKDLPPAILLASLRALLQA
jgi:hypothetical protein